MIVGESSLLFYNKNKKVEKIHEALCVSLCQCLIVNDNSQNRERTWKEWKRNRIKCI
jgi:hypothetical protein